MQLIHIDMGSLFIIFPRRTRCGKPPGNDQALQDGINDIHELLFVAVFPAADFARLFMWLRGIAYLQKE